MLRLGIGKVKVRLSSNLFSLQVRLSLAFKLGLGYELGLGLEKKGSFMFVKEFLSIAS